MPASRIAMAALVVLIAAACQPAASATPTPPAKTSAPAAAPSASASTPATVAADAIAFTVSVTGGECPNGPCGAEYVVYGDGRVEGPGDAARAIPKDRMDLIADEVARTDWDVVRAVPFASTCPTAYDGQKHIYAFPARGGDVVLDSCEFDLSQVPLVQSIDAALFGG